VVPARLPRLRGVKITGITLVRDEADVLRVTLPHHLAIGCDDILVLDNGSTDGTRRVLQRLSRRHPIAWTADDGPYRQAELTTELAREAARQGADWIVPFDADEFWWSRDGSLRELLAATAAGALRASVVNFVQRRRQRRSARRALAHMTWRAEAVRSETPAQQLVEAGEIAFVEIDYPPKHVARASETIVISKGNHDVAGVPGPVEETTSLACLHAPLRSRAVLEAKAATAPRVEAEAPDPGLAWQTKRWGRLAAEGRLDAEWAANSESDGALDVYGMRRPLVADLTLRDLVQPWLGRRSDRCRLHH
jgi:glycosyltransferase involved in cell wall biosynthesis